MKIKVLDGGKIEELDTGVTLGKYDWVAMSIPMLRSEFNDQKFLLQAYTPDRDLTDNNVASLLAYILTRRLETLTPEELEEWRKQEWEE